VMKAEITGLTLGLNVCSRGEVGGREGHLVEREDWEVKNLDFTGWTAVEWW